MNYNCNPSLKHISFINTTALLWNQEDIRSLIKDWNKSLSLSKSPLYMLPQRNAIWRGIEQKVREKVSQVSIPESLKETILRYYVEPVGVEIFIWLEYHSRIYGFNLVPKTFCWTNQGIIDKKGTAEILTKDKSINIVIRFKVAVIYCLENHLSKLWDELPASDKINFHNKQAPDKHAQPDFILLWERSSKGKFSSVRMIRERLNPKCSYQYAFLYAGKLGNKAATEYFFNKLTTKEDTIVKLASYITDNLHKCYAVTRPPENYMVEVLFYLLPKLNKEQQINVLKNKPLSILGTLAGCWPWQIFFIEISINLSNFLDQFEYDMLLNLIVEEETVCKDYNYKKLFREFWQLLPSVVKIESISGNYPDLNLISNLLVQEDTENIKFIFQDLSMDKKDFIFSINGKSVCKYIISENNWKSLTLFIQLFLTSSDDIKRLKLQWHKQLHHFLLQKKDRSRLFFKTFEDICSADNKRKFTDEDECSPAKRLFSYNLRKHSLSLLK